MEEEIAKFIFVDRQVFLMRMITRARHRIKPTFNWIVLLCCQRSTCGSCAESASIADWVLEHVNFLASMCADRPNDSGVSAVRC